jgi:ketosteroid isomerase-like protein
MSQENVEIVRRSNALLNEGDVDAAIELLDPAVEWVIATEHPEARTLFGRGSVAAYQRDWQRTFADMHFKLDRVIDVGDKVLAVGSVGGTGSESGASLAVPLALVLTLRGGLITRGEEYLKPDEALKAVGLEE